MWKWVNCLEARAPRDRSIVHLNFDETAFPMWLPPRIGYIARGDGKDDTTRLDYGAPVSLRQQRASTSCLVFLADAPEVQRRLPLWIFANRHTCRITDAKFFQQSETETLVYVRRRASAWCTSRDITGIIAELRRHLEPFMASCTFLLSLDGCPTHLTPQVAQACGRANIGIVFIPRKMTGILQPLDTHVFQPRESGSPETPWKCCANHHRRQRYSSATSSIFGGSARGTS